MSNTYIDDIRTIASELSDMSPKTQMEIVRKCKNICEEVADAIETEVANEIADETATLQTQITTNTNNIATNTSNIATNTSDIATLESAVATNTSNIATNTSNIATNTNDITTINNTLGAKADLENTSQDIIADTFNAKDSDYYYTEYGTGTITNKTGRYTSKIISLPVASTLDETCTLATTDDIPEIEANPSESATGTLSKVNIDGTVYSVVTDSTLLSSIVDNNGNARFVEGDGTPVEISGITSTYYKWSLSGSHLMLVYAGTITGEFSLSQKIISFSIPAWVLNKIAPVGSNNRIEKKPINIFSMTSVSVTTLDFSLYKDTSDNTLNIQLETYLNVSQIYGFRIQFDLLIDTE